MKDDDEEQDIPEVEEAPPFRASFVGSSQLEALLLPVLPSVSERIDLRAFRLLFMLLFAFVSFVVVVVVVTICC